MTAQFSEVLRQAQVRLLRIADDYSEALFVMAASLRQTIDQTLTQHADTLSKEELIQLQSALHSLIAELLKTRYTRQVQQLTELARHDGLTGLLNRSAFNVRLIEEVARAKRYGRGLTLVMFDVDSFKSVNDTFGHQAGDRVLVRVAVALQSSFRQSDAVFRYGGDEFAVLCPETSGAMIEAALRRIETQLPVFTDEDGFAHRVSVSYGVASLPTDAVIATMADDMIGLADQRLYLHKRTKSAQSMDFELR